MRKGRINQMLWNQIQYSLWKIMEEDTQEWVRRSLFSKLRRELEPTMYQGIERPLTHDLSGYTHE